MLYIAEKCADDADLNITRLNKILYFADFQAFAAFGKSISGAGYIALPYGPAPKGADDIRRQMVRRKELFQRHPPKYSLKRTRLIARREADLSLFTAPDIAILDEVIEQFWGVFAKDASRASHGRAWEIARANYLETGDDRIPYEAAFISDDPIDEADIERARELNAKFHWE
jgi:hypothetical protein